MCPGVPGHDVTARPTARRGFVVMVVLMLVRRKIQVGLLVDKKKKDHEYPLRVTCDIGRLAERDVLVFVKLDAQQELSLVRGNERREVSRDLTHDVIGNCI